MRDVSNLKYTQHGDMDNIIEEGKNMFTAMRLVSWTETAQPKLDIRKYFVDAEGNEKASKGIAFDPNGDAPNALTLALIKEGYGDTEDVINGIKTRQNFMPSLVKCLNENPEDLETLGINPAEVASEYYDPMKELFDDGDE